MASRLSNLHFGSLLLAAGIALVLWGMAHSASTIERGFDVPVVFQGLPDELVLTDQTADVVNIRVLGTRAALRNITASKLEYPVEASGNKPGLAIYEVDTTQIEVPRGVTIVSRSPAILEANFEQAARRSVRVRPDIEGEVAEGYLLLGVTVEPREVWLTGARSEVLRLREVVTETLDISGLEETTERKASLFMGTGHVWMEQNQPVTVRIEVARLIGPELPPEPLPLMQGEVVEG
ncbi:CdaR family protein [Myxococcota bacterium]|nr:CdaR family protein [Myxococcota bacterium]